MGNKNTSVVVYDGSGGSRMAKHFTNKGKCPPRKTENPLDNLLAVNSR